MVEGVGVWGGVGRPTESLHRTKKPVPKGTGWRCGIITDYLTFSQDYIKVVEFVEWLDLVRFPVP